MSEAGSHPFEHWARLDLARAVNWRFSDKPGGYAHATATDRFKVKGWYRLIKCSWLANNNLRGRRHSCHQRSWTRTFNVTRSGHLCDPQRLTVWALFGHLPHRGLPTCPFVNPGTRHTFIAGLAVGESSHFRPSVNIFEKVHSSSLTESKLSLNNSGNIHSSRIRDERHPNERI